MSIFSKFWDVLIVVLIASFFCFYRLGAKSFGQEDETIHSLVVQEMIHSSDYLHPKLLGDDYFNKPPLKMWLNTLPVRIFGESEFSYRCLDAASGVLMAIVLYLFANSLFHLRIVSFSTSIFLLSCYLFYHGHGVRNAVQDSFMLLFDMCALYFSYLIIEALLDKERIGNMLGKIFCCALLIGAAILTKGMGGAIVFPIVGVYILFSGQALYIIKRSWWMMVGIFILSFLPIGVYILFQEQLALKAFHALFYEEGLYRATHGYHHINHSWYYWKTIVSRQETVPIVSLLVGLIFLFLDLRRLKDVKIKRAIIFSLCWAFVPIFFYQTVKSKLFWYLMPSLGGLSIISGYGIHFLIREIEKIRNEYHLSKHQKFAGYLVIIVLLCASSISVGISYYVNFRALLSDQDVDPLHQMAMKKRSNKELNIYLNSMPHKIAMHETFYFNQMEAREISVSELQSRLKIDSNPMVIYSSLSAVAKISKLHQDPTNFQFISSRHERKSWLGALTYNIKNEELPGFRSWCARVELAKAKNKLGDSWNRNILRNRNRAFLSFDKGRGRVALEANYLYRELGSRLTLKLLSSNSNQILSLYLNDELLDSTLLREGYSTVETLVPANAWDNEVSILTLRNSQKIDLNKNGKGLFIDEIVICPSNHNTQ